MGARRAFITSHSLFVTGNQTFWHPCFPLKVLHTLWRGKSSQCLLFSVVAYSAFLKAPLFPSKSPFGFRLKIHLFSWAPVATKSCLKCRFFCSLSWVCGITQTLQIPVLQGLFLIRKCYREPDSITVTMPPPLLSWVCNKDLLDNAEIRGITPKFIKQ